jgi:RimJ/RimL family protein N-acetyltransferase
MDEHPSRQTARLCLRPFTLLIPHPYEEGMAEKWIATHQAQWEQRASLSFAIVLQEGNELCGAIGLRLALEHERAELGYWIECYGMLREERTSIL